MKKIVIFGANGNIGREAVKAFSKAGWQVRAVTRDGIYAHDRHIEAVSADAMDKNQVVEASQGCDFIFNALNVPYTQWSSTCLVLAQNIMAAAKRHQAVHLFPANVYNYGTNIPQIVKPDSPTDGDTQKGRIRIDMENLFDKYATQHQVQTIILRAGDFFGGEVVGSTWFDMVIAKSLSKGKMTYPGAMGKIHAWAYLPDFAQSFVDIARDAKTLGNFEMFHFEGHCVSGSQLKTALENVLNRPLKCGKLPWALLRAGGLVWPMWKEICEMSYLWNAGHQLDGSKLAQQVGDIQSTPLEQALRQSLTGLGIETPTVQDAPGYLLADVQ